MAKRLLTALALGALSASPLAADPANYATPQDALEAFAEALVTPGKDALISVFSAEAEDILSSGDPIEDKQNRAEIVSLLSEGYRMVPEADGSVTLALGAEGWPFPVPLARSDNGWSFDLEAGRDEILLRRIGRNELEVIDLMDAYVDLQARFRLVDSDADGVMEFARRIISSDTQRDGLFWSAPDSPVGELLARASFEGYSDGNTDYAPEPYSGYYFLLLTEQGDKAPGGAMNYLVSDNMVAGHAMLAVPADYGNTGVNSFMVSENGIVLEADLGEDTLEVAEGIEAYNPDDSWSPVD